MTSMSAKPSLIVALIVGTAFSPFAVGQQSAWKPFAQRQPYSDLYTTLDKDASASDPAGIHFYAEDLAHTLVPDEAGEGYINSFADRLAKAEQETRDGQKRLIPDTQVVEAFNELARNEHLTIRANLDSLRQYRTESFPAKTYTNLITAARNGTNCEPGEAIFLLTILLQTDGKAYETTPQSAISGPRTMSKGLSLYLTAMTQGQSEIVGPFNALADRFWWKP